MALRQHTPLCARALLSGKACVSCEKSPAARASTLSPGLPPQGLETRYRGQWDPPKHSGIFNALFQPEAASRDL